MDFFTATSTSTATTDALPALSSPAPSTSHSADNQPSTDAFAEAINARFSRKSTALLIPLSPAASPLPTSAASAARTQLTLPTPPTRHRMPPPTSNIHRSSSATSSMLPPSASLSSPDAFTPIMPEGLHDVLDGTLVVDIRPHNAYALARLPAALSLSVPSTLLKRPLFSLDKLTQMLSSEHARERFSKWHQARRILVYDADSAVLSDGCNLLGLMRKFRKEGFTRDVFWLKGGFRAVWRERLDLVDQHQILDDDESPASVGSPVGPSQTGKGLLRTGLLPMSAFDASSTTSSRQIPPTPMHSHPLVASSSADSFQLRLPPQMGRLSSAFPLAASSSRMGSSRPHAMSLNLPTPLLHPTSSSTIPEGKTLHSFPPMRVPMSGNNVVMDASSMPTTSIQAAHTSDVLPRQRYGSLPGSRLSQMAFNPFFDNIRQNIELGGWRGSGEGIPLRLPRRVRRRVGELPFEWLREIGRRSGTVESESEGEDSSFEGRGGYGTRAGSEGEGLRKAVSMKLERRNSTGSSAGKGGGRKPRIKHKQRERERGKTKATKAVSDRTSSDSPPPRSTTASGSVSVSVTVSDTNSKAGSASPPPDSSSVSNSNNSSNNSNESSPSPVPPPELMPTLHASTSSPSSDSDTSGDDLARTLALQFYKIELGEQRRLMGVMEHHSKESMTVPVSVSSPSNSASTSGSPALGVVGQSAAILTGSSGSSGSVSTSTARDRPALPPTCGPSWTFGGTSAPRGCGSGPVAVTKSEGGHLTRGKAIRGMFPFSITAGVEKGDKNRYRNIWPFEHARVRLRKSAPEDDDYMNASYVQPLGTTKRYIATQGPLPSTFADFWALCWQENVHVVVMLTREVESALVKCGNYWADGRYGCLTLKMISTTDTPEREQKRRDSESSGFFNVPHVQTATDKGKQAVSEDEHRVKRVFELTNAKYPDAPPRIITQLQYLDWPDLDVPKDPRGLLQLMQEVDDVVEDARRKDDKQWGEGPLKRSAGTTAGQTTPPRQETSLKDVESDEDELDSTGVSRHAVGRAPVLLHCSAGVGRTGGFIAVDAILDGLRREMRKRREQKMVAKTGGRQTTPSSASRSPMSSPMEVDRSSASPVDEALKTTNSSERNSESGSGTGLTLPMSAGGNEVHVPIVGFDNDQEPMEVDDSSTEPSPSTTPPEVESRVHAHVRPGAARRETLRASSALMSEVRSARLKSSVEAASPLVAHAGVSPMKIHAPRPVVPGHRSDASSSGASSSRRSTSFSGLSLASSENASSSTASLTNAIKAVDASLGAQFPSAVKSAVASSAAKDQTATKPVPLGARMDSWRSRLSATQAAATVVDVNVPSEPASLEEPKLEQDSVLASPRDPAFDYTEPRRLHDDASPPLLSTYDEPVRRVIEDMREQRMSLCQSLRQYVFVHRAIIEGALRIMDEERHREREEMAEQEASGEDTEMSDEVPLGGSVDRETSVSSSSPSSTRSSSAALDTTTRAKIQGKIGSPLPVRAAGLDRVESIGLGPAFTLQERAVRATMLSQAVTVDVPVGVAFPSSPLSPRTKRQASPTELVKEDSKGMPRLLKRPSVKRRARTPSEDEEDDADEGSTGGMKLGSLILTSPPPPTSGSR